MLAVEGGILSDPQPSGAAPEREGPLPRDAFLRFVPQTTRWKDNDAYGHLNNVVYYELFDAAVNALLIEGGLLDPTASVAICLVVESNCRFFSSLAFPEPLEVGVRVERIGRSSVNYLLAVFGAGASEASAQGRYTHVYVDRISSRPTPIPAGHRRMMETLIKAQ